MDLTQTVDYYFSGQGEVMLGQRNSVGRPKGLIPVGNVSDLKISVAASNLEHKESRTGLRGTDLRLTTELKVSLAMTIENYSRPNLARALRATSVKVAAGVGAVENIDSYFGRVTPLKRLKLSAFALKQGAVVLTPYVDDDTPFDYKVNREMGSYWLNDGKIQPVDGLVGVVVPTAITAASPTVITVANTAAVGDQIVVTGLAGGAKKDLINGIPFTIIARTAGSVTIAFDNTGASATIGVPLALFDGFTLESTYSYAGQETIDALNAGADDAFMRFEGLNTASTGDDGFFDPVVVEVFKFATDPLKELSMIGDTVQQFVLDGSVLFDSRQSGTGVSKYFRITKLAQD